MKWWREEILQNKESLESEFLYFKGKWAKRDMLLKAYFTTRDTPFPSENFWIPDKIIFIWRVAECATQNMSYWHKDYFENKQIQNKVSASPHLPKSKT